MVIPYSQWRRRYDNDDDARLLSIRSKRTSKSEWVEPQIKEQTFVLKPASPIEPSHGINQTSNAGKPEASAKELINFPARRENSFTSEHRSGKKRLTTREEKTADPTCPVETSFLPDDQQVTTFQPRSVKEEGDVTLNDAYIPDSIATALFDALQEKRTGNQLLATMIVLARLGGAQLQLSLVTGENHQVRSSSLPKSHGEPYVRGYLESTEYCCTCTDTQQ